MASIIGLTGGIASGKSTVSKMLEDQGFTIVDADLAARVVVEQGEDTYKKLVNVFGKDILLADGAIDRSKLGSIIFHDKEKREMLNSIVHPAVRIRMNEWKEEAIAAGKQTIIYDIPLLFESNLVHLVEKIILVYVDEEVQLKRLVSRNSLSEAEAKARIASQLPLQDKVDLADAVIDNNGTIGETKQQVEALLIKWNLQP
ncbi:dephospho-CoA kinase [Lederbergia citrea]|uniref:dephospho-CoA kinase n=1 Tax=Lederbergia citrea TaxID=2833581 RepID=UPI001BC8D937|nr:dephospho-CoA kinase [Lederbergia citrea]MBS4202634.1 dephospho-CoA kinase [Lederbergia citrea]